MVQVSTACSKKIYQSHPNWNIVKVLSIQWHGCFHFMFLCMEISDKMTKKMCSKGKPLGVYVTRSRSRWHQHTTVLAYFAHIQFHSHSLHMRWQWLDKFNFEIKQPFAPLRPSNSNAPLRPNWNDDKDGIVCKRHWLDSNRMDSNHRFVIKW